MSVLAVSFLVSLLITFWVIRSSHLHSKFSSDSDIMGIQKFHTHVVPRIGGLGILLGLIVSLVVRYFENEAVGNFGLLLIASSLPAFIFGFVEDITKKVGVKVRLIASFIAAAIAGHLLGGWLTSVQILGIDNLMLAYPAVAIGITCFAVAGVANAFNIIDGYNGLTSMVAIIILSGLTYVAFQVGDTQIMIASLAMIGALLGFLIWNYPRGLIFLGDGGAYLVGFWIAELSVLLTARHPEVSKWFPLLLCIYPIFETLFTIYRRVILKRINPGIPDALHLHQLIYRRIVRWDGSNEDQQHQIYRNSMTSPYLWLICLLGVIPAVLFWRYQLALIGFVALFAISYVWIYLAIVRYKIPEYLISRR
ncbi:glycosyltransferase [Polynucleobacter sp. AP-Ainpum-60-G11]|uniref:MraY family glycosyltransferase n=1 Tax=Polynucleobacter sp. AP-Ainpum-60-G11 TaxID=2576926 RepID=UPI001BFE9698|nr:glycosyltransferase [Polynucleobacter sp. AP-Ainpum-60-G11]QWE27034.1 glycosyltransferase family 4 protein [Polynucleobacter sp. AP-Ainpum-60-G11]